MEKPYDRLLVRLDEAERYMIWGRDEENGLVLDNDGEIPLFNSREELQTYANNSHLLVEDKDAGIHNLDEVQEWILFDSNPMPCDALLSAWNLFSNISITLNVRFSGNAKSGIRNSIYEKLFWGSNRPTLSAAGTRFTPIWTRAEKEKLRQIMLEGLSILRGNIKFHA